MKPPFCLTKAPDVRSKERINKRWMRDVARLKYLDIMVADGKMAVVVVKPFYKIRALEWITEQGLTVVPLRKKIYADPPNILVVGFPGPDDYCHFYFVNKDYAMLFKLTFG